MFYDYSKRDYLLPNGCKDLIDVLNLKQFEARSDVALSFEDFVSLSEPKQPKKSSASQKPAIGGEIVFCEPVTVRELAELLDVKPFQLVAELMSLKVLATENHALDFETVCKVAAKYGYTVKKAA